MPKLDGIDYRRWEAVNPETGDAHAVLLWDDLKDKPWGVFINDHLTVYDTEDDAYGFALANARGLYHIVHTTENTTPNNVENE